MMPTRIVAPPSAPREAHVIGRSFRRCGPAPVPDCACSCGRAQRGRRRRVSDAELPSRVHGALPRRPGDCERVGRYPLEGPDQLGVTRAALEREMNDWDLAGPR